MNDLPISEDVNGIIKRSQNYISELNTNDWEIKGDKHQLYHMILIFLEGAQRVLVEANQIYGFNTFPYEDELADIRKMYEDLAKHGEDGVKIRQVLKDSRIELADIHCRNDYRDEKGTINDVNEFLVKALSAICEVMRVSYLVFGASAIPYYSDMAKMYETYLRVSGLSDKEDE